MEKEKNPNLTIGLIAIIGPIIFYLWMFKSPEKIGEIILDSSSTIMNGENRYDFLKENKVSYAEKNLSEFIETTKKEDSTLVFFSENVNEIIASKKIKSNYYEEIGTIITDDLFCNKFLKVEKNIISIYKDNMGAISLIIAFVLAIILVLGILVISVKDY